VQQELARLQGRLADLDARCAALDAGAGQQAAGGVQQAMPVDGAPPPSNVEGNGGAHGQGETWQAAMPAWLPELLAEFRRCGPAQLWGSSTTHCILRGFIC
jgi:hypothetical protein